MKLFIATATVLLPIAYIVTTLSHYLTAYETIGLFIILSCAALLLVINSEFVESDK